MNQMQTDYLKLYLKTRGRERDKAPLNVSADYFCADEENVNICADLIRRGEKTASCSLKCWYESGLEPMPQVGNLQVVTDWAGHPTSIIETVDVSECRYADVTEEFASAEGEGDRTLSWWREAHWAFFSEECRSQGWVMSEEQMLVLERFKVVYPASH